jgi:hypothetical protein
VRFAIGFLRRLLGVSRTPIPTDVAADVPAPTIDDVERDERGEALRNAVAPASSPARADVSCPSCAALLEPPPIRSRRCPVCRQPIVVRQVNGRRAYMTEAALAVFEAQRRREAEVRAWTSALQLWLELAISVGLSSASREKLARAAPSAAAVEAARDAYLAAADQAVRRARRDRRWADVGRIRRAEAAAVFVAAGSPVPPPDDIVQLHREGMVAVLRELAVHTREAELVGARCCKTCRSDDGKVFTISEELREPRLPHPGCPKGICECDWWIAFPDRKRRRSRRRPRASG